MKIRFFFHSNPKKYSKEFIKSRQFSKARWSGLFLEFALHSGCVLAAASKELSEVWPQDASSSAIALFLLLPLRCAAQSVRDSQSRIHAGLLINNLPSSIVRRAADSSLLHKQGFNRRTRDWVYTGVMDEGETDIDLEIGRLARD